MLLKVLNSKHLIPAFLKSLTISTGALAMLPRLSYINLTSTPLDAFSLRISRILFSISPSSIIKYSIKINFSALLSSLSITGNISSPSGKYVVSVLLYVGARA